MTAGADHEIRAFERLVQEHRRELYAHYNRMVLMPLVPISENGQPGVRVLPAA